MGIFGKKKNQEEELKEIIEKLGLDFQSYDEQQIANENNKNVKQIATDLANAKLATVGAVFGGGNNNFYAIAGYLRAIVSQNWVLIRQNELLLRTLKKHQS